MQATKKGTALLASTRPTRPQKREDITRSNTRQQAKGVRRGASRLLHQGLATKVERGGGTGVFDVVCASTVGQRKVAAAGKGGKTKGGGVARPTRSEMASSWGADE
jgi:hypothetical protein